MARQKAGGAPAGAPPRRPPTTGAARGHPRLDTGPTAVRRARGPLAPTGIAAAALASGASTTKRLEHLVGRATWSAAPTRATDGSPGCP